MPAHSVCTKSLGLFMAGVAAAFLAYGTALAQDPLPGCYQSDSLDGRAGVGAGLSFAIAPGGERCISYWDEIDEAVQLLRRSPLTESWIRLRVADGFGSGAGSTSLDFDAAEQPHVCYATPGTNELFVSSLEAGGWVQEPVNESGAPAADPVFLFDAGGFRHVAYFDPVGSQIWYANDTTGSWSHELVGSATGAPDFVFDASGNASLAYVDGTSVVFATRTGAAAWALEPVNTASQFGPAVSLDFDAAGEPRVAYSDNTAVELLYSYRDASSWQHELVHGQSHGGSIPDLLEETPYGSTILFESNSQLRMFFRNESQSLWWGLTPIETPFDASNLHARLHPVGGFSIAHDSFSSVGLSHRARSPWIAQFSVTPLILLAEFGATVDIEYDIRCAECFRITPIVPQTCGGWTRLEGTTTDAPTVDTTYQLRATNEFGSSTWTRNVVLDAIGTFTVDATSTSIILGEQVEISWYAQAADWVTVVPPNVQIDGESGSLMVTPSQDQLYTVTATNYGYGSESKNVYIDTQLFGPFDFDVDDPRIVAGESATLSWNVPGADLIEIEPGGFSSASSSGQLVVSPTETATYTLTATKTPYGSQEAQLEITVDPFLIRYFNATPQQFYPGDPVELNWQVDGMAQVEILGEGPVGQSGSLTVFPADSRLYELRAEWQGTVHTDSLEVEQLVFPQLDLSFSPTALDHSIPSLSVFVPFDVYVAWNGTPRSVGGVEFGVDLPPDFIVASAQALAGLNLLSAAPEIQLGYPTCASPAPYTSLLKLSLVATDADAFSGAVLSLRGMVPSSFSGQPGMFVCNGPDEALPTGPSLSLDASATATPRVASATRILELRPNPFNPQTEIHYELHGSEPASITIFDLAGRRVRRLEISALAGRAMARWNGQDDRGRSVASGVYLVSLEQGGQRSVRRALLLK